MQISTGEISQAFADSGEIIDVTPQTTAGDIVRRMGYDPETTDLVQRTNSGLPKIIKSNQRFDPSQGQYVDIQIHGDEGMGC